MNLTDYLPRFVYLTDYLPRFVYLTDYLPRFVYLTDYLPRFVYLTDYLPRFVYLTDYLPRFMYLTDYLPRFVYLTDYLPRFVYLTDYLPRFVYLTDYLPRFAVCDFEFWTQPRYKHIIVNDELSQCRRRQRYCHGNQSQQRRWVFTCHGKWELRPHVCQYLYYLWRNKNIHNSCNSSMIYNIINQTWFWYLEGKKRTLVKTSCLFVAVYN